jgi:hypothetical protein
MSNELQIRLSGDISALQAALTKAKATIKSFESETDKESEKGNVGFKRKIGLIEQLTNKAKNLRTALSQATNETQIAKYNAELEQTSQELARLNALGRSVSANLGSTAGGFGQVARQGTNANGVAQEFNRVIQDAPFGLIGIGNNLQQLAGNFANVSKQAGGTGAAIKASLASIISPVNLGLLAVSALTAGFTAYQMGAFDFIFANEESDKSLKDVKSSAELYKETLDKLIDSLNAVNSARLSGSESASKEIANIDLLRGVIEDESNSRQTRLDAIDRLQKEYPNIFKNIDRERILIEGLSKEYGVLTAAIFERATASAIEEQAGKLAVERVRLLQKENSETTFQNNLFKQRNELELKRAEALEKINAAETNQRDRNEALRVFSDSQAALKKLNAEFEILGIVTGQTETELQKNRVSTDSLKEAYSGLNQELIGLISNNQETNKALKDTFKDIDSNVLFADLFKDLPKRLQNALKGLSTGGNSIVDIPIDFNIIPENADIDDSKLTEFVLRLKDFNDQISGILEEGAERSLGDFAFAIGDALGKGNNVLEASGAALLGGLASILNQLGQLAIGTGIAIAGIKKALQTLNPAVAIGAGVALIALAGFVSAKAKSLGGFGSGGASSFGSSGGSASVGAPPQIFTNANTVTPPSPFSPTPSGNIDFDRGTGRLDARIDGGDIVFVYDRYKERQRGGG